jgi:hypothetical protein
MAPPRTNKESAERDIRPLWMDQFRALERFVKKHDRLPYMDENKALCKWTWKQREYSKGRGRVRDLLQEERKLLESIVFFDFESRRKTPRISPIWYANFEKLKRSNGNYISDNAFRSWLISQRGKYRRGSLQPMKIKLLDDLPFDWMTNKKNGENPTTRRSPPSSSGRSQLATKPTTVVEEALLTTPSADPKPAAGDFPPGWMHQSKPRSSGRMDHYWISPAGKRFCSLKKASVEASAPSLSITAPRSRATRGTSTPPRRFLGTWSLEELSKGRCGDCTNCNREHCRDCDSCKRSIGEGCLRRVSSMLVRRFVFLEYLTDGSRFPFLCFVPHNLDVLRNR